MPTLATATGPVVYDECGSGPTIVLLPSGGHRRRDFDELRALLAPRMRTVSLDWPGHGESPAGERPVTAMSLADVAEEAICALAPQGALVLGNSVGGFAAARLALRRPELVAALIIVDGGGFSGRPAHERLFCALMSRPRLLRTIYPLFARAYMRARTDADRRALGDAVETTRRDPGLAAVASLWGSFTSPEHDLRADARLIGAPTLVLWGRRDPVIAARTGRRIARMIPGARFAQLDAGHVPHTSDPQGVAAELLAFARSLGSAVPASAA